jgi:hypothetical protein
MDLKMDLKMRIYTIMTMNDIDYLTIKITYGRRGRMCPSFYLIKYLMSCFLVLQFLFLLQIFSNEV